MKQKLFGRLAAAAVLLLSAASAMAHDFEVDGIYYNKNSDGTSVSVTYKGSSYSSYSNEYSGAVTIPASVTYSGKTYSVTSIGEEVFRDCSGLESVTIPNSVTSIGDEAFSRCYGLTSVSIGNSVTSIGQHAFRDCANLEMVLYNAKNCIGKGPVFRSGTSKMITFVIGAEVEQIGDYVLGTGSAYWTKMFVSHATQPPVITKKTFGTMSRPLYVPKGTYAKYLAADVWREFRNIIEIENPVTDIVFRES